MLPTAIRNTAHAIADALAGSGGAGSPFLVSPDHSMLTIGIVMGSITLLTASLVWTLPETKGVALGTAISRSPSLDSSRRSTATFEATDSNVIEAPWPADDGSSDSEAHETAPPKPGKDVRPRGKTKIEIGAGADETPT